MTEIIKILKRIADYKDRIFCLPLSEAKIKKLERELKITFPGFYSEYLKEVGLLQDLVKEDFFETKHRFILEKKFSDTLIKNHPELYFPFGTNGYGDLLALKDSSQNDEHIYIISHENGKLKKHKKSFPQLIDESVNNAIKDYKNRKKNVEKNLSVQFSFEVKDETVIFQILEKSFQIEVKKEWKHLDTAPSGVAEYKKGFILDGKKLTLKKLEYKDWEKPSLSINFDESVLNLSYSSKIEKIDYLFSNSKGIDYKLVRYGIL